MERRKKKNKVCQVKKLLDQLNTPSVSTSWHSSHTRDNCDFLSCWNFIMIISFEEHLAHSSLPQWRQWWRRLVMLNLMPHSKHSGPSRHSGIRTSESNKLVNNCLAGITWLNKLTPWLLRMPSAAPSFTNKRQSFPFPFMYAMWTRKLVELTKIKIWFFFQRTQT